MTFPYIFHYLVIVNRNKKKSNINSKKELSELNSKEIAVEVCKRDVIRKDTVLE